MKDIAKFIVESLKSNYMDIIPKAFNAQCKPSKFVQDLNDKDKSYLLLMSLDTHELIKEYTIDVERWSDDYMSWRISTVNGLPNWVKRSTEYKNKTIEHLTIDGQYKNGYEKWWAVYLEDENLKANELLFIVWNKENKDKFIEWFKKFDANKSKKSKKEFNPKIPSNLYYDEILTGTKLINKIKNETEIKSAALNKLFDGIKSREFMLIEWDGNYRGFENAANAIEKLFPRKSTYHSYIDNSVYADDIEDMDNSVMLKFISKDNRSICVIDTGDYGHAYVCVEK